MTGETGRGMARVMPARLADFALNPALDTDALRAEFAANRRVRIADFLADGCTEALREAIVAREDWALVVNAGEKVYDLDSKAIAAMPPEERGKLDDRVNEAARDGFQFRFSSVRVPDNVAERQADDPLHAFVDFIGSRAVLSMMSSIARGEAATFADGQATAYRAGDFLTSHDDDIEGKNRTLAYVMGLTLRWRAEWGGLLLFHGEDGQVSGWAPDFNTLDLFAVPQLHSVSAIAAYAGETRYSITGWLRRGAA